MNLPFLPNRSADETRAIRASQAVIEFDVDGTIRDANEAFVAAVGYSLDEIRGKHHRMFVEADYGGSEEYTAFWKALAAGRPCEAQFLRIAKGGRRIWLQAVYTPIADAKGRVYRVVKFASDISAKMDELADYRGQVDAIRKSQAVIEFDLTGKVVDANATEVRALSQRSSSSANEIKGLIANTVQQIGSGVGLVRKAGVSLSGIVSSANEVAGALSDIRTAANEQSSGIDEVARVVAHLDETTQRNSAMAEDSATVSRTLTSVTENLSSLVGAYRLTETQRPQEGSPRLALAG